MVETASTIALIAVSVAGTLCLLRILKGPSLGERVVAADTLVIIVVAGLAVGAARTGSGVNASVLVVVTLVGFLGTSFLARFMEGRGPGGD